MSKPLELPFDPIDRAAPVSSSQIRTWGPQPEAASRRPSGDHATAKIGWFLQVSMA